MTLTQRIALRLFPLLWINHHAATGGFVEMTYVPSECLWWVRFSLAHHCVKDRNLRRAILCAAAKLDGRKGRLVEAAPETKGTTP